MDVFIQCSDKHIIVLSVIYTVIKFVWKVIFYRSSLLSKENPFLHIFLMFRDIAPEGDDLKETNANLDQLTDLALELQEKTGVKLLWATCNLFANPRYLTLFTPWHHNQGAAVTVFISSMLLSTGT